MSCIGECTGDCESEELLIAPEIATLAAEEVPVFKHAKAGDIVIQHDADELVDKAEHIRVQLRNAVMEDNAPVILELVTHGANMAEMQDALSFACARGSNACVREMVAIGVLINSPDMRSGFPPLHIAASVGHVQICEILLGALADASCKVRGIDALGLAHKTGNTEVVEVLERHIREADGDGHAARRTQVIPAVSPFLSDLILQSELCTDSLNDDTELVSLLSDLGDGIGGYTMYDKALQDDNRAAKEHHSVSTTDFEPDEQGDTLDSSTPTSMNEETDSDWGFARQRIPDELYDEHKARETLIQLSL